jgi:TetR/AcrR family transcriptional regulator
MTIPIQSGDEDYMSEPKTRQFRTRNAQKSRETILNAAESVFAQHGFDGARIDAITKASGYNTSLLFQYFTDKLGLYVAVLMRADQELNALLASVLTPWLSGGKNILDAQTFKTFVQTLVRTTFDYLVEHPQFLRILTWEMAEGWKTYVQIASQFAAGDNEQIKTLFREAYEAGLLRSDFYPALQLTLVLHLCQSYCAYLPLYQVLLSGEDISSSSALARAREYIAAFVVAGMMTNPLVGNT